MEYRALTIGLADELFSGIQAVLASSNLRLTPSLTVRDAGHMLDQQMFQLLIVELEYLRNIGQTDWLDRIRQITLIPIVVLSDNPKQDTHPMIELGADLCVYGKDPYSIIANVTNPAMMLRRRQGKGRVQPETGALVLKKGMARKQIKGSAKKDYSKAKIYATL